MSTKKKNTNTTQNNSNKPIYTRKKASLLFISLFFALSAIALLISFISYFKTGNIDQSILSEYSDRTAYAENWLGKLGAYLSDLFLFRGFGIASFLFVKILFTISLWIIFRYSSYRLKKSIFWDLFAIFVISFAFGHFGDKKPILGGIVGYEINSYFQAYVGNIGTMILVLLAISFFVFFRIKIAPEKVSAILNDTKDKISDTIQKSEVNNNNNTLVKETVSKPAKEDKTPPVIELKKAVEPEFEPVSITQETPSTKSDSAPTEIVFENNTTSSVNTNKPKETTENTPLVVSEDFIIEQVKEETPIEDNIAAKLVADFGEFDPTLELSNFQFPTVDLLVEHASGGIQINQAELEENKNKIVETLNNYKIGIDQIKATVGPTVTLYEIVPEAGIRISKIKNLEDDIALSLSALGIRIIAPIPGKGTIGIEVPNTKPSVVSMKSLISSPKFQNAEMELPIALGKTISNETYVVDLAKMPHLLMAGATGQGKSVGLNAVLTSLLYKKHPAEVKFVLVDPKKVELTLFNKIERHYLAKLPDTEDAIITDNTKVINTLNSLCIEMDNRYSLLKDAMVRNIKEYNEKFKQRKLNPENGHRFLPYIVLVVDEFADLIMTAGKEVETPIARLAQLARAIGIHLIIATQRPSVNVITGIIKANFPARIAFRVTSKIDSRTILDGPGADQLIGRGDLLYTQGNDMIRVQCGFVDTPEVEKITEFIGAQKAYSNAYLLPEYVGEESGGTNLDIDISERDSMFREAAEIIVSAQQGSASLLQRKLKLGYNRAGRLIDQLEAAGIVGPFEGSKARSVNIPDLVALERFFEDEKK